MTESSSLGPRREAVAAYGYGSPLGEAFRMISQSLQAGRDGARIVVVTSAVPGEGKSFIATGLAVAMSREGRRVLLVDADLHQPSLHLSLDARPTPGVYQLLGELREGPSDLTTREDEGTFVQETDCGVALMPAGIADSESVGSYVDGSPSAFFDYLRKRPFECVVIDSPPLLLSAGANLLAAKADDVLLTVRSGYSRERDVKLARTLLERNQAPLRGAILNDHVEVLNGRSRGEYAPRSRKRFALWPFGAGRKDTTSASQETSGLMLLGSSAGPALDRSSNQTAPVIKHRP